MPDIGQIFPDNDPKWSGADSTIFMEEAYSRMVDRGFRIGNVDVTLILQKPKVGWEGFTQVTTHASNCPWIYEGHERIVVR